MKNLYSLILGAFFSTSVIICDASINISNFSENEKSELPDSDYVKGRSMFVNTESMKIAIPLGFSEDNNYVFGAIYNLIPKTQRPDLLSKPVFFISSVDATSWDDIIDENNNDLASIKFYGKFIVSIGVDGRNDLHIVEFGNGRFSVSQKLPDPINSIFNETSGTFAPGGTKIYFSSNREEGYGGYDIYESEYLGNDRWTHPRNLGEIVNTEKDEESPFLLNDGVTLYYSSDGLSTSAKFDVFETILGNTGFWEDPYKLESPINTDNDDMFFRISPDEKKAFYMSGGKQGHGIYKLIFD